MFPIKYQTRLCRSNKHPCSSIVNVNTFVVTWFNLSDFIRLDLKYLQILLLVDLWLNDLIIRTFYQIFPRAVSKEKDDDGA